MKGLLKYIQGGLKMATVALPVAITLGGTAAFIWLGCNGDKLLKDTYRDVQQNPEISQQIEEDLDILQNRLDNKEITKKEYLEQTEEYNQRDFLYTLMKSEPEKYGEYIKAIDEGNAEKNAGIICGIITPIIGGLISSALYLCTYYAENLVESAKEDFRDAHLDKMLTKNKKEEKDYAEEIIR